MIHRSPRRFAGVAAVLVSVAACGKSGECVSTPLNPCPGDNNPPGQTVTGVTVTSPTVDSVMAVGMTAQLAATATVSSGTPPTTFNWSSTPPSVATVSGSGLVNAVSAGTATISAETGGTTGNYRMRAVDADLAGITALTTEPYFLALVGELDPASATELNTALTACAPHVASGNLLALDACVLASLNTSSAGGHDDALFGVIDLYLELALDYVGLGS